MTASTVYRYRKKNNLRYLFLRSIDGRGGRPCRRPCIPIAVQPTSHDPNSCDPDNYDSASCDPDSCDPASCDPKTCDPKEADSRRQDAKRQEPREARCQEVGAQRGRSPGGKKPVIWRKEFNRHLRHPNRTIGQRGTQKSSAQQEKVRRRDKIK